MAGAASERASKEFRATQALDRPRFLGKYLYIKRYEIRCDVIWSKLVRLARLTYHDQFSVRARESFVCIQYRIVLCSSIGWYKHCSHFARLSFVPPLPDKISSNTYTYS